MKYRFAFLGSLLVVVLAFALVTGFPLLMRLFYVLSLALAGGYLWAWLNLRWLDAAVERRTPVVSIGQSVEERITVRNTSFLPKPWLEVTDLNDIPGHYTGQVIGLSSRGYRSWRVRTPARRRGVFSLGPLRIATGDPFGLFRLERLYQGNQQVVVLPAVVPLVRFLLPSSDLPGEGQLRMRPHQVSPHVATVREYAPGDSLHRIHWPSSARQGTLMVKEFDIGLSADAWVLLDLEAQAHVTLDDDSTEELAVTAAASIARHLLGRGMPVGFAASSAAFPLLPPDRGDVQDSRILDALAKVKADGPAALFQSLAKLDPWLGRQTVLVIVTPSAQRDWLEAIGALAQRGVRIAVVLVDAATFGGPQTAALVPSLRGLGAAGYLAGKGENLAAALDSPVSLSWAAQERAMRASR